MKKALAAFAIGVIVGILTLFGQKYLPINLNFLANSGAIWLIPAFMLSFFFKSNAKISVISSVLCLLGCVYGYYVLEAISNHHKFAFSQGALLWSVMAVLAGCVFGFGAYLANTQSNWLKYCGLNLLPAVFISEGTDEVLHIADYQHMIPAVILKLVIGIVIYVIINQRESLNIKSLSALLGMSALGVLGFGVLTLAVLN